MLTHYVTSPVLIARLQSTPCWPYLDGFTEWLAKKHFTDATVQLYLFGIPALGQWLLSSNISVADFDHHSLSIFQRERDTSGNLYHGSARRFKAAFIGARRFQEYLIAENIVLIQSPQVLKKPLLSDFESWMTEHRGIKQTSLCSYARYINDFIDMLGQDTALYEVSNIRHYFQERAHSSGVPTMQLAATSIRVFLRYLVATGRCESSLPDAVQSIVRRKLSSLPRYISIDSVDQLIDSCDELFTTPLRDRAILLLLARLALRAGDVAGLQRSDIDWRQARIRVSGKSRRECWLPLTQQVGYALADYCQNERPDFSDPHIFIKSNAPCGPISARVVSSIVGRAVLRTGIDTPSKGSHLLRHSAASAMLSQGANLEQIGSVLRHKNLDTTAIYAKINYTLLNQVVAPWPTGAVSSVSEASLVRHLRAGKC